MRHPQPSTKPPLAQQVPLVEMIAGRRIADPYRWMELDGPEVRAWAKAQEQFTTQQLAQVPARAWIEKRLEQLIRVGEFTTPIQRGERFFFRIRKADQELSVLYVQTGLDGPRKELIDQNQLSADHSTRVADAHISGDGSLMAYRLSKGGNSKMALHVFDVDTGTLLPDVIPGELNPVAHAWHTKNEVCWVPDNSGFYYTRRPISVPAGEERYHQKVYFHRLGDSHTDDALIFGETLGKAQLPYPQLSDAGRWLLILVQDVAAKEPFSEVYVRDLQSADQGFVRVEQTLQGMLEAKLHRDKLFLKTNHGAPCGKIVSLALGTSEVSEVIKEGRYPIIDWHLANEFIFVETLEAVSSRLRVYDLTGRFVKEIALPNVGSLVVFHSESEGRYLFFSFSSFFQAKSVYRLDLATLEYQLHAQQEVPFDPANFEFKQSWYEAPDKTPIPMYLLHRKGLVPTTETPTMLYGYGGFGFNVLPSFNAHLIPFLEQGGLYAIANIRGGGEFGENWHTVGVREKRQLVFDDFIAAAEWLIAQGFTSKERLACYGWSNGGLLVSAVSVQRPDLWRAVVAGGPVTDLLRFHTSTRDGNKHWVGDYGDSTDPNDLPFLLKLSPYHNLPKQVAAPAMMFMVPEEDDRVAPWHGRKMLAQWQAASTSDRPLLLRGEEKSGHNGGTSANKTIELYTDIWTFIFWQLGVQTDGGDST